MAHLKTTERILDTALILFNERGTGAVSTNHIAEAAGISPGNLYYHYSNKEEIIRALFERLFGLWDTDLTASDRTLPPIEQVKEVVYKNFEIMWRYRFVYRELLALLRQDAILQERYVMIRKRGYDGFHESFAVLGTTADEGTATRLADLVWLISEFWLSSVEVSGETVSSEQMQHGIDLMMQVLRPYITE